MTLTPAVTLKHFYGLTAPSSWAGQHLNIVQVTLCHKPRTPRSAGGTEFSLTRTVLSRATQECVYRCLRSLHCPCLNTSDFVLLPQITRFPLKVKKIHGHLCKVLDVLERHRVESSPSLRSSCSCCGPPPATVTGGRRKSTEFTHSLV